MFLISGNPFIFGKALFVSLSPSCVSSVDSVFLKIFSKAFSKSFCIFSIFGISIFGSTKLGTSSPVAFSKLSSKFLKKSVILFIVSANLSCKSFSFIPSNILVVSPKFVLSFIVPTIVNNINCKYFHIDFLVFSVISSQLYNKRKFTFGKKFTSVSSSILKIVSFSYIISKNRVGYIVKI